MLNESIATKENKEEAKKLVKSNVRNKFDLI